MTTRDRTFEDRLLTELRREITLAAAEDARPAPARGPLFTPARAGVGLVTAAAAAGAFLLLPGGGGTSAYAVQPTTDGRVRVTISDSPLDEGQVREFAAALEENGVSAVQNLRADFECLPPGDDAEAFLPPPGADDDGHLPGGGTGNVTPVDPGETVYAYACYLCDDAEMFPPLPGADDDALTLIEPGDIDFQPCYLNEGDTYLNEGDTVLFSEADVADASPNAS